MNKVFKVGFSFHPFMSISCVFKSSLSLKRTQGISGLGGMHQALSPQAAANQAFYIFLKGQVTVIESIIQKIDRNINDKLAKPNNEQNLAQPEKDSLFIFQRIRGIAEEVLSSKYMNLMKTIHQSISSLQMVLNQQIFKRTIPAGKDNSEKANVVSDEEKLAQQLLTTCLSLSMYFNKMRIETERAPLNSSFNQANQISNNNQDQSAKDSDSKLMSPKPHKVTFDQNAQSSQNEQASPIAQTTSTDNDSLLNDDENGSDSDDFVVCRICDEKISIDDIDNHTTHCVSLYNSATFVTETDEKIRQLRDEISLNYLNVSWPGPMNKALSIYLPILNAISIIEQVLLINLNEVDAIEELTSYAMAFAMNSNESSNQDSNTSLDVFNRFKPLIDQKLKASRAIKFHSDELNIKNVSNEPNTLLPFRKQVTISDFLFVKRISSGAFARVFLARKKKTGDIYAIKVIPKSSLTLKNQVKRIMAEKDILLQFSNPYIVSFYYSIIGENNLYLVMEYLPGGDLYSLLQHLGSLDEDTAKVYTMQIVMALKYLKKNGIIHRDLKPDNILISKNGTLKLTDFGLSFLGMVNRHVSNGANSDPTLVTSNSYVGTPDYIAPEILMSRPHSFAVDLWSLGVILYEFLMGDPPFHGETETETHENILRGRFYIDDEELSPEAIDLISRLLRLNPDDRIGSKDIDEVLQHPWFQGVNPDDVPFKPELESKEDTNYFESRYELSEQDDKDILEDMVIARNTSNLDSQSSFSDNSLIQSSPASPIGVENSPNAGENEEMPSSISPCVSADSFSFGRAQIKQVGSSDFIHLIKPNKLTKNSPTTSSLSSLSPNTLLLSSTSEDGASAFPEMSSLLIPESDDTQINHKKLESLSAFPGSKNVTFLPPTQIKNNFESVSLKTLAQENKKVADRVRRRRSISFTNDKEKEIGKRRNSDNPTKKYIGLSNFGPEVVPKGNRGGSIDGNPNLRSISSPGFQSPLISDNVSALSDELEHFPIVTATPPTNPKNETNKNQNDQ